jgi:glutamyl-tRNA synthetase
MREMDDDAVLAALLDFMAVTAAPAPDETARARLAHATPGLKTRARTLRELADSAYYILATRPLTLDAKAAKLLDGAGRDILVALLPRLREVNEWCAAALEPLVRDFAAEQGHKLGAVAQPVRAALTGRGTSPGVFDVLETLGAAESLARLEDQANPD